MDGPQADSDWPICRFHSHTPFSISVRLSFLLRVASPVATMKRAMILRSARLALACVVREFPVGTARIVRSRRDARTHRLLHPAFYGCIDVSLVNRIVRILSIHITPPNIRHEAPYFSRRGRSGFERPNGLAWVLQLSSELRAWDTAVGRRLAMALRPLEKT